MTGLTALLLLAGGAIFTGSVPAAAARDGEGWLGVRLQSLTPHLKEAMDLDEDAEGALVAGVVPDSPADAAGIRQGDLIVEIDDHPVDSVNGAVDLVRDRDPGDRVLIVVQRDGRRRGLDATLGDRTADSGSRTRVDRDVRRMLQGRPAPEAREDRDESPGRPGMAPRWKQDDGDQDNDRDESFGEGRSFSWHQDDGDRDDDDNDRDVRVFRFRKDGKDGKDKDRNRFFFFDDKGSHNRFHVAPRAMHLSSGRGGFLGVETMGLSDQLAEYFQAPGDAGVLVTRVVKDSPAADAGLQAGDVIVAVDGKDIEDSGDLLRQVRRHDPGDSVKIEVIRKGSRKTLNTTLGKARDFGMLLPPDAPMPPGAPMPPEPPMAPEDIEALHLHLDRLRDIPGLENLELPDIEVDVRGLDREHMQELREDLRELRRELRENLHENLRDIHEQLRESRGSWQETLDAMREAREAYEQDRERAEGTTTVM